jgi:isoleucyl-tRNA synthetase
MEENTKKSEAAKREERILEFWKENGIFEKTLSRSEGKKEFVFYEGPPGANGRPHIGHFESRAFKDAVPRYKTMRGYHVRRKAGWDTHGLPVELQVEKTLGLNSKKAIEEYGIAEFNKKCKESVWEYLDSWDHFTNRMGYWVDQKNAYVTYHNNFIESVWNVIKKVNERGLLYKDYRIVPWCPRCGTALSSHELAQGYEDVKDLSITAKFKIIGKENTYILAWTTTPWTLPGNVALAVGEEIDYVKVKVGNDMLILAKERLSIITDPYEIIEEIKGKDLIGLKYEPLFPFLQNSINEGEKPKLEKAFQVYGADFVTTKDGTGVVHTAVMYGQDDFVLGNRLGLPKQHLVGLDGKFFSGTGIFEGRFVKDEEVAVDIIKDLAHRELLFKKEKYEHSYPHCWRCKTPLIYYARDSWYIRMSEPKLKEKLIKENKEIHWEPEHFRDGRFGEWLKDVKDWAISRERYWGTPLPVWECETCKKREIIGSIEELKKKTKKSGNKYFLMRHGEAEHNTLDIYSSDPNTYSLTEKGKEDVQKTAKELKKMDVIYSSPFLRAKETAELLAETINFPKEKIIYDQRLGEYNFGELSGQKVEDVNKIFQSSSWQFDSKLPGGESSQDAKNRFGEFLYEIDKKHKNENVLIVSHGIANEVLPSVIEAANQERSKEIFKTRFRTLKPGSIREEAEFIPLPHNENYELDLHRPYIDEVEASCDCGGNLVRSKEVMDVWLDSGCMPFAQDHYPFENRDWVEGKGYPADYISEGLDQTRGWFYTLHAVGMLMERGKAFKNVICLGMINDKEGKKMSKSLGNVTDPFEAMEKHGADTLRLWMYSVNQPGDSKNFDEKTVAMLHQQVFGLLYNVLAFYELYPAKEKGNSSPKSKNILDKWILAKLDELVSLMTENLEEYKLLEPVRGVREFISDLSTWYLRRSRERIKEGDEEARQTLYFVLKTLAKLLAPFAPFAAEDIWLRLKNENEGESIHLESWPSKKSSIFSFGKPKVLSEMENVRKLVTLGLEARQMAGIKVRQPLAKLEVKKLALGEEYLTIMKEELNVKEIAENQNLEGEVSLDTGLTESLREEGDYRELARSLQEIRKKLGLTPSDMVTVTFETSEAGKKLIEGFSADMKKTVQVKEIIFAQNDGEEIKIGDLIFKAKVQK